MIYSRPSCPSPNHTLFLIIKDENKMNFHKWGQYSSPSMPFMTIYLVISFFFPSKNLVMGVISLMRSLSGFFFLLKAWLFCFFLKNFHDLLLNLKKKIIEQKRPNYLTFLQCFFFVNKKVDFQI